MKSTNKSKEAEREKLEKKLTNSSTRSPGTRKSTWWNHLHFNVFQALISHKSHIFKWPVSQILRKKHECVVNFISHWLKKLTLPSARSASTHESTGIQMKKSRKKLTYSSARSPGTRKRTGSYLLNLYDFQRYICPKKAPFRVVSLTDTHNKNTFVLFIFLAH